MAHDTEKFEDQWKIIYKAEPKEDAGNIVSSNSNTEPDNYENLSVKRFKTALAKDPNSSLVDDIKTYDEYLKKYIKDVEILLILSAPPGIDPEYCRIARQSALDQLTDNQNCLQKIIDKHTI
jgi:hypothetical protein